MFCSAILAAAISLKFLVLSKLEQQAAYKQRAQGPNASAIHSQSLSATFSPFSVSTVDFCFHINIASILTATKMAFTRTTSTVLLLLLAAVVSLAISSVNGAKINVINQCGQTITACATCCGGGKVNCYVLNKSGGKKELDVGGNWPAGVVWGFPGNSGNPTTGNNAKPQANLAEITVGANGQDSYDISNVDAYNLPMRLKPTKIPSGETPSGTHCGTIVCDIKDLRDFCKRPNFLTGAPGEGCKNANGPGQQPTDGTRAFKRRCPHAYSYSKDDAGSVFGCKTGSNFEVVFCPANSVIEEVVAE